MTWLGRLSLRQWLLLVLLLPTLLATAGIAALFLFKSTTAAEAELRDRGLAIVSFLAPAAEYGVLSGNRETLSGLLQATLAQRDVAAAAVYDRDGARLAVSGHLWLDDAARVTALSMAAPVAHGRDDEQPLRRRFAVGAPVMSTPLVVNDLAGGMATDVIHPVAGPVGWVYIEFDTRALNRQKMILLMTTLGVTAAAALLATLMGLWLARMAVEPISQLLSAVGRVAAGEPDVSIPDSGLSEELRTLQRGFNTMARHIAEVHQTLKSRVDEATAQLAHQALHDPLTGLPNRRAFEQALEEAVTDSRRAGDQGALCFIDLDRFKIVNDTCGHAAGDELLRRIAVLIRQRVRAEDSICRIGGDEFALILRGCQGSEARRIAESLREAVSAFRFNWSGRRFSVGASVGLVRLDGGLTRAADVLVAADMACYAAKKGGRNQVVEHVLDAEGGEAPTAVAGLHGPVSAPVREAVPYDRLALYHQRIQALMPGSHETWFEILLRVRDEHGAWQSAQTLLTELAPGEAPLGLDIWVAEQACARFAARAPQPQPALLARFSLNLGRASVLAGGAYVERLADCLSAHAIAPARVVLEFPASLAEQAPREAGELGRKARELGCALAFEKLEGGSVGLLRAIQPDYVKISLNTLVESYGLEAGCNLAQALCGMANALGVRVVASEVEDELFKQALRDYGFDFAQGRVIESAQPFAA